MKQLVGKVCPYCKGVFSEDDDVVVCSECEMPHHKACWMENQGCTTFGCTGTIESPEQLCSVNRLPDADDDFEIDIFPSDCDFSSAYCPTCGSAHDPTDLFCKHCGSSFASQSKEGELASTYSEAPTANNVNRCYTDAGVSNEDRYIARNIEYYQHMFSEMRASNKKTSWNWAAFFFAPYWCFYRKLYGIGAGVLGGAFVLSLMGVFGRMLILSGYVVFGIYANHLYMQHIQKQKELGSSLTEPMLSQHIQRNGGTNLLAAILLAIGYSVLVTFITL